MGESIMEFKQLQSFVEVVRNLSFTKASQELYVSQPTVSMHIHQLESELGVRLIIRTTKSLEVTEIGRRLYEYAVNILSMRDRMIANCSLQNRHILSLGASTIPSAYLLPKILPSFAAKFPESYFVIHQSDSTGVMEGLLEGIYDLGIIGMKPDSDSLTSELLCTDHIILIAPVNDHFISLKDSGADVFDILKSEPVILRESGSGSGKKADEILQYADISEDQLLVTARANDQEAIKNMVAGGLGVSLISRLAAEDYLEGRRLISFEFPDTVSSRSMYLVYRTGYILQDDLQNFIQFLKVRTSKSGQE